uniref:Senescence domain-containing protein n=1 Tax=Entomoneis paludosa TaxID=265537 RepID=A0A7S3DVD4_9STRA|mmetsp:Transcript_40942/g.85238  ORF Transcript_40942/g.85238 Transcript_40942/m.85238 type:complete len:618 (+) Transcript_40942:401-2254(+)
MSTTNELIQCNTPNDVPDLISARPEKYASHGDKMPICKEATTARQMIKQSSVTRKTRTQKRRSKRNKPKISKKEHPPWIVPKRSRKQEDASARTAVSRLVSRCQEEVWNEFVLDFFCGLFENNENYDALVQVFECLYYMGMARSVLESSARLIVDQATDDDMQCLAQYLAHGVTRVPTPMGISQRLVLLQIILSFREQQRQEKEGPMEESMMNLTSEQLVEQLDPVALWHFIMGNEDVTEATVSDPKGKNTEFVWQSGSDDFYFWCWEIRALALSYLVREEEQRVLVQSTADQVAHAMGMAAVTVELGLSQSTQLVCQGMGHGCEWIKGQLGSPVKASHFEEEEHEEDAWYLYDDKASEVSNSSSIASASSTTSSIATSFATASTLGSANSSKKTKEGIVHETYTSYSRTARRAAESARKTTQTFVAQWKDVGNQKLNEAAESGRTWAGENVHSNAQHWAYLDAASKIALASLGAMGVVGEAVLSNTQLILDHTTTVTADLVHHQYGPTAANVFEDVSMAATNVWRTVTSVAVLASPFVWTKVMVKHASKERLRKQHEQEQLLRQQRQQAQDAADRAHNVKSSTREVAPKTESTSAEAASLVGATNDTAKPYTPHSP